MNKEQNRLNVCFEQRHVGWLWKNDIEQIGFQYTNDWISKGFPISQQMPLTANAFPPEKRIAHYFFANLLPEAGARQHIVRDLQINDSDFTLLNAIGGECAGALSLLPPHEQPSLETTYQRILDNQLNKILLQKGHVYTNFNDRPYPRLSLAGAQDKYSVFFDGNHYYLPINNSPSSHILKFELSDYKHVPVYEYVTTLLAKMVGLSVAELTLCQHKSNYYLRINRFDRLSFNNDKIKRLHQEDFCQALGYGHEKKYQAFSGPRFSDCFKLLQKISLDPIEDAEQLIRWQIFNVLAGNSDGHAKNISFLYNDNQQPRLAPFYDLVCTRAIAHIDQRLAFSIGDEFIPGNISMKHWEIFARECDIRFQYLSQLIKQMAEQLLDEIRPCLHRFEMQYGDYPALERIKQVVTQQCKKTLRGL